MKKVVLLAFVLVLLSSLAFNIRSIFSLVRTEPYIYIRSDGSVVQYHSGYYHGTALIQRDGDTYTFTENIYSGDHQQAIVVQRNNIVVDGAGYTLQGTRVYRSKGIVLTGRSNVTIKNLGIKAFGFGIYFAHSSNNTIYGNNITNNGDGSYEIQSGIYLYSSSNNSIFGNNIMANNYMGIYFYESSNNIISGNNITNNASGMVFYGPTNNLIYHNNFINNIEQVVFWIGALGENVWDNGVEGNYWSNYAGVDSNHDGIGDSPHDIAWSQDYYPLMGMFHSFNTSLGYYVNVISNSTIEDFTFFESNSTIRMYVSNMTATQTFGFCRVCIPKGLMSPSYTVIIDDGLTEVLYFNDTVYDDGTYRWIYFAYEHSTHKVEIVPEFPTWTSMLLIFIVLTIVIAINKRRLLKTPIH